MHRALRQQAAIVEQLLQPETELEKRLLTIPEFKAGLHWGIPRFGHPEGQVFRHIKEVLDNIDRLQLPCDQIRQQLRLIAFAHDTFKYKETKKRSSGDLSNHHATLARHFMETHTTDSTILNIIQWHDEAYYCWRTATVYRYPPDGEKRLAQLLDTLGDDLQRYYQFFVCDTRTGDKNQAPVKWLEERLEGAVEMVQF